MGKSRHSIGTMTASDLPEILIRLIRSSVPTFPAAELLLFFLRHPDRAWTTAEITHAIRPTLIAASAVDEYVGLFKARGLLNQDAGGGYRFQPESEAMHSAVELLAQAYNERPVTLIRTIYALGESRIQSFADSFKFNQD